MPQVSPLNASAVLRMECLVLLRNSAGHVLMVKPAAPRSGEGGFELVGGAPRPRELPQAAAAREAIEETGLAHVRAGDLLVVDYRLPRDREVQEPCISLVFDGGVVPAEARVTLPSGIADTAPELEEWRYVPLPELEHYCQPFQARRVRAAVAAAADLGLRGMLADGRRV